MVFRYLSLCLLYINTKTGKKIAGGVFDGVFLYCPFFPLDVLDEIWDLIESVSDGFLTYS